MFEFIFEQGKYDCCIQWEYFLMLIWMIRKFDSNKNKEHPKLWPCRQKQLVKLRHCKKKNITLYQFPVRVTVDGPLFHIIIPHNKNCIIKYQLIYSMAFLIIKSWNRHRCFKIRETHAGNPIVFIKFKTKHKQTL